MDLEEIKDAIENEELEQIELEEFVEPDFENDQEENTDNYFVVSTAINILDDSAFSLIDKDFNQHAVCVIKNKEITVYFADKTFKNFRTPDDLIDYMREEKLRFKKIRTFWKKFNPNPFKRKTGDCTLRAYCAAFGISWNCAYDKASKRAKEEGYILDDTKIVEKILCEVFKCQVSSLYNKKMVKVKDRRTVKDWAMSNPYGTFICHVPGHLVTIRDGKYYDNWDSGDKKIDTIYLVPEND